MKQGIVWRRIVALGSRPEFWLISLLLWVLGSAARSFGTPWASAALTEALRWGAGVGLALALGWSLRQTAVAGQFLISVVGAMALAGILGGESSTHSGLVGPYHDHQLYGSVLLLLLPFAASFALSARHSSWRWGALAAFTAGVLCLLLSQTRSAWAGFAAATLVFGWLRLRRTVHSSERPPQWRIVLVPTAILVSGLIFTWLMNGPADQQAALESRAATWAALSQDGSWQGRLQLWRGTARLIEAHPALGIGLGRYPGEQWLWTHAGGPLSPAAHPSLTNEAHSFYGQTCAETGLIGLGLYLAAITTFAAAALRRLRRSRSHRFGEQNSLRIAVLAALAGQSVDALASPSWQFPEASIFFWAVLGIGLASLRVEEAQTAVSPLPQLVRRVGQWALSGGLAVVLAAQVLPMGLLTPVEAYDHLATNVFQSMTIQQVACTSGSGVCFSLTAVYSDGNHDVTFDNGGYSLIPASFKCTLYPSTTSACNSTFGTGNTRNQLTVHTSEIGKEMIITGSFVDGSYPSAPFVSGKGTYTGHTSAPIDITP